MEFAAQVFALIAALLHIVFFLFESVLFKNPKIQKRFFVPPEAADSVRVWAFNQGFYNLFLALGIIAGVLALNHVLPIPHPHLLVTFPCACMVGAGLVLAVTDKRMLRAAAIQIVPALVAFVVAVA